MALEGQSQSERSANLLTVVICTWNRAALLAETLEQLVCLTIPPSVEWELCVVDNNSTDTTRKSRLAGTFGVGHSFGYGGGARFNLEVTFHKTLTGNDSAKHEPPSADFMKVSFGWVF